MPKLIGIAPLYFTSFFLIVLSPIFLNLEDSKLISIVSISIRYIVWFSLANAFIEIFFLLNTSTYSLSFGSIIEAIPLICMPLQSPNPL